MKNRIGSTASSGKQNILRRIDSLFRRQISKAATRSKINMERIPGLINYFSGRQFRISFQD
jgi:hypothetical protein